MTLYFAQSSFLVVRLAHGLVSADIISSARLSSLTSHDFGQAGLSVNPNMKRKIDGH